MNGGVAGAVCERSFLSKTPLPTQPAASDQRVGEMSSTASAVGPGSGSGGGDSADHDFSEEGD